MYSLHLLHQLVLVTELVIIRYLRKYKLLIITPYTSTGMVYIMEARPSAVTYTKSAV